MSAQFDDMNEKFMRQVKCARKKELKKYNKDPVGYVTHKLQNMAILQADQQVKDAERQLEIAKNKRNDLLRQINNLHSLQRYS